jgi:LysM repeat protein
LAKIAGRYQASVQALMDANEIHNANLIYKGQKLCVP